MPIEIGMWRLGQTAPEPVRFSPMETEKRLEDILAADISILGRKLLLIGRQTPTDFGAFVDLLAIAADGKLVIIELKRNKTPRDVVAQALDYGSWGRNLKDDDIGAIFDAYQKKYRPQEEQASLDEAFCKTFGLKRMPETLNDGRELVVVAAELDNATERIVNYLAEEHGVAINVGFFRFFRDGEREYLTRAWLIDPAEMEAKVVRKSEETAWNGEFYVSFGDDDRRRWLDAVKYGFISAGGGSWYIKTLGQLGPGDRVWVNVPAQGYVGVGRVVDPVVKVDQFMVTAEDGTERPITEMPVQASDMFNDMEDEDFAEHLVRVEWIKTFDLDDPVKETGFFGNQNTVAKPKVKRWEYTIERLKKRFGIQDPE